MAKKFHNTTTFFNYYYNGELKWQEGVDQINAAYRVPPEGYIDVMYSGTETDAQTYADNFEQAIEKAEIALQKHDQKDNKWFDQLRFLIGRSWYYKRSYILAIKNFEHVIEKWPDSKIIPDVYLWLVKTHYMDGNNTMALKILDEKLNKMELSKRQKGEKALIQAQVLLDEMLYDEVVRVLNKNKKNIKGKNNRARVYYLMGQIYADQGSYSKAYEAYKHVTKINTDYELIFNAKINIARLMIAETGGSGESAKLNRFLKKMLKDEKNIDYKDQIYYEMAMLYLEQENLPRAIDHLTLSIKANTNNQRQKAVSYYKIGQIYFYDLKQFTKAEAYFDSAATAITTDAPEYAEISSISKTLKEYVGYVNTIHEQDSLLALSKLTDDQLAKRVDKVIEEEKKREEEAEAAQLEALSRLNDPNLFNNLNNSGNNRKSGFYFDSPELVSNGRLEFEQRWGSRKNEDNWRRKNKQNAFANEEVAAVDTVAVSEAEIEKYGSAKKARLIKNVPRTDAEIEAANDKVMVALYGLGQVYENKLMILDSAIANYKKLVRRYPNNEYTLKSQYALYKIYHDKLNDELTAAEYESQICRAFPNSRYCVMIKTGVMAAESDAQFEDFQSAYTALLTTYNSKDYETATSFGNFIAMQYPAQAGLAEVHYIRGKSFGFLGQRDSLKSVYGYVKRNFPESDVIPEIDRTLAFLNGEVSETGNEGPSDSGPATEVPSDDPRFKGFTDDRKPHEKVYIVMLVDKSKIKSNELQQKLNEFNQTLYPESRLNVSVFLYKGQYHLPYISQFNNEKEGMAYISNAMKEPGIGDMFTSPEEKMVFITPQNFRTAYGKKRFEDYFIYYENVVLKALDK